MLIGLRLLHVLPWTPQSSVEFICCDGKFGGTRMMRSTARSDTFICWFHVYSFRSIEPSTLILIFTSRMHMHGQETSRPSHAGRLGRLGPPRFFSFFFFFFCRFSQAKKKNKSWRDDTLITQRVALNKGSMIAFIAIVLCRSAAAMTWLG